MSDRIPDNYRDLYYMAPFQNAASIVAHGIYSYNRVQALSDLIGPTTSIADPFVNARRHGRIVLGRTLHDYVPLYWSTHTPMQYVVTEKERRLQQCDLIFFVFSADELLQMPGVMTTDGNAAANETRICEGTGAIPCIDWSIVAETKCYSPDYKRRKCAEVLVPDHIPNEAIREIRVYNQKTADNLRDQLVGLRTGAGPTVIRTDASLYYHCPSLSDLFD